MAEKLLKDEELNEVAGGAGNDYKVIGTAKVLTNNLNIRPTASTAYTSVGQTNYPAQYDVFEVVQNEGYIWYRIAYRQWIANDGTWVQFIAK